MGEYHEVILMMMSPHHHEWFGQKNDERTSNQNKIAQKPFKPPEDGSRQPRNRSKKLNMAQIRSNSRDLFDDEGFLAGLSRKVIKRILTGSRFPKTVQTS